MATTRPTLGDLVKKRRLELGLSKDAAAAKAFMSPITWTRVEEGQSVRLLSLSGVDRVLGWEPGSCFSYMTSDAVTILPAGSVGPSDDAEPYAADDAPDLRDVPLDSLLAEVARRARDNNPEAR